MLLIGLLYKYIEQYSLFQQYWYFFTLLFAIPQSGLLVRGFMIFHDCCHNSYLPSPVWNKRLGYLLSFLTLTPFQYWKSVHIEHHANFGNRDVLDEADTIFFTLQEYRNMPRLKKIAMRLIREPLIFFTLIPIYPWWIYYPIIIHSPFTLAGLGTVIYLAYSKGMWYLVLAVWMGNVEGFILFHLQHAVNVGYRVKGSHWSFFEAARSGSTCIILPKFLRYFTLGIQYHHIHHYQTRVPCYRLEECHHEAPEGLWDGVTFVTFKKAWQSIFNVMYDEENNCFVTFKGIPPENY